MINLIDGKYQADGPITCGDLTPKVLMDYAKSNQEWSGFEEWTFDSIIKHITNCSMCRMAFKDILNRKPTYQISQNEPSNFSIDIKASKILTYVNDQVEAFLARSGRDPIRHELREFPQHVLMIDGNPLCKLRPMVLVPLGTPELPFDYLKMAFPYTEIIIPITDSNAVEA